MKTIFMCVALFVPVSVAAQTGFDAGNPQQVAGSLQTLGYRAVLETGSSGNPRVRSAIDGTDYSIWFYGCNNGVTCTGMNFSVGFNMSNGLSMASVNDWNRRKLVGRVYLDDENDPFVDYFVDTSGGMSTQSLEAVLSRWEVAVTGFKEHIGW